MGDETTLARARQIRRIAGGAALVAAPALLLAADLLFAATGNRLAWAVLAKLAFALFVPAIFAIVDVCGPRAPVAGLVAGAIAVAGSVSGACIVTASAMASILAREGCSLGPATAGPAAGIVVHYPLPGLAFPAGMLALAWALGRARTAPRAAALLLAIGAICFPIGRIGDVEAAIVASGVAFVLALAPLGWRRLVGAPASPLAIGGAGTEWEGDGA